MPGNSIDYGMMPPTINRLCAEQGVRRRWCAASSRSDHHGWLYPPFAMRNWSG